MKLDNKEKYERIRRFVGQLKLKPDIEPFFNIEDIPKFGIYDFFYINKNPSTFQKVEKKLKEHKYEELPQFLEDLKQIFIAVSDYVLQDDPLQAVVDNFKQQIDKFAQKFEEDFKVNLTVVRNPQPRPAPQTKNEQQKAGRTPVVIEQAAVPRQKGTNLTTNLTEKLEMLFLLRANQNNQAYIRSIGSVYEIGTQMEEEYVITLDNKNACWLQFLSKQEQ